jgi:D-glycero-D-manno-heptose 1,7-bisphosphate phosphatase
LDLNSVARITPLASPVDTNPESQIENPKFESPRPVVFLDRDGTLMDEVDFCRDPAHVRAIPGAKERLTRLRQSGWAVVVITNQSGIGRGIIRPEEYEAVHAELLRQLDHQIDGAYFCPDVPPHVTHRRKPGTGMIEEAVRDLGLDLSRGYFVGDKPMDIACGHNAGLPAILVRTGYGKRHLDSDAEFIARDVTEALDWIFERESLAESC